MIGPNRAKLYDQGRCKFHGVPWTDAEVKILAEIPESERFQKIIELRGQHIDSNKSTIIDPGLKMQKKIDSLPKSEPVEEKIEDNLSVDVEKEMENFNSSIEEKSDNNIDDEKIEESTEKEYKVKSKIKKGKKK